MEVHVNFVQFSKIILLDKLVNSNIVIRNLRRREHENVVSKLSLRVEQDFCHVRAAFNITNDSRPGVVFIGGTTNLWYSSTKRLQFKIIKIYALLAGMLPSASSSQKFFHVSVHILCMLLSLVRTPPPPSTLPPQFINYWNCIILSYCKLLCFYGNCIITFYEDSFLCLNCSAMRKSVCEHSTHTVRGRKKVF